MYFEVFFNLKVILYVAKITQNIVTVLLKSIFQKYLQSINTVFCKSKTQDSELWYLVTIWSHNSPYYRSTIQLCQISNALCNHVTRFCSQIKCAQYWPSEGTEQYGDIEVTATDWIEFANYTITTFQVCKVNKNDLSVDLLDVEKISFVLCRKENLKVMGFPVGVKLAFSLWHWSIRCWNSITSEKIPSSRWNLNPWPSVI